MPTENRSSNTEMVSPAPAPKQRIYVEVRECEGCNHIGIDDEHKTLGACHECDWSGPEPVEDKCPGCERENVMAAACPDCGSRYVLAASKEFEVPAPQPHPDPIAWMVGTAFWWTKEEAERDAAATGLQAVPIGPMASQCGEPVWFMTEGGLSVSHAKAKAMSDQQGLDTSSYRVPLYTHADPAEVERLREEVEKQRRLKMHVAENLQNALDNCSVYRAQLAEHSTLLQLGLEMINRGIVSFDDQIEYRQKLAALAG